MSSLPSKLFFRIGEVSGLVGVEPHVLRYWEREFRSIKPTKSAKGQRVYSRKDVENLLRVRDLLYRDGFTIAGAKKRLQLGGIAALPEVPEAVSSADLLDHVPHVEPHSALAELPNLAPERCEEERSASSVPPELHAKLCVLRAEVEAFLDELGPDRGGRA